MTTKGNSTTSTDGFEIGELDAIMLKEEEQHAVQLSAEEPVRGRGRVVPAGTQLTKTTAIPTGDDYADRILTGTMTPSERAQVYKTLFAMKSDGETRNETDGGFKYAAMAEFLIDHFDIKVFASTENTEMPKRVVMRVGGRYVTAAHIIPKIIVYLTKGVVKERNIDNVLYAITNTVHIETPFEGMLTNARRANFMNGVVDVSGDAVTFRPRTQDDVFFTRVPHEYPVAGGECPVFQEFLDYALAPKYHPFIYEWIGYCFFETYEFQKMVFHFGKAAGGKSTLLRMISAMLGAANVSPLSLKQMTREKFMASSLSGKMANHGSEVSYKDLKEGVEILKQLSSGADPVLVEQKYEKAYPIINTAKLTFAMNDIPKRYTDDEGFNRRLVMVDWKRVMPADVGARFNDDETGVVTPDEVCGAIFQAIKAFHAMVKRGTGFSYSPNPKEVAAEYTSKSDSIGEFAHDCIEESDVFGSAYRDGDIDWEATSDIYNVYVGWCKAKDITPAETGTFTSKAGIAKTLEGTPARRCRQNHDGKRNVRGWRHIKLVSMDDGIQTAI